jgi:hypothetical protein
MTMLRGRNPAHHFSKICLFSAPRCMVLFTKSTFPESQLVILATLNNAVVRHVNKHFKPSEGVVLELICLAPGLPDLI